MINVIIEAVKSSMQSEFGPGFLILTEKQKQEELRPYFFLSCISLSRKEAPGKREYRQHQFCIQYVPNTENPYLECNEAAEKLMDCLLYITAGGAVMRGTGMKYERKEDKFYFYVNYDCFVYETQQEALMETVGADQKVKG